MESATNVTGKGTVTTRRRTAKAGRSPCFPVRVGSAGPGYLRNHGRWCSQTGRAPCSPITSTATSSTKRWPRCRRPPTPQSSAETGKAITPKFPTCTPHDLGHTCASQFIRQRENIKVIQRQLGHATAAMTLDTHGHLFDTDLKVQDSNLRRRKPTDLQSAPIGRSGNLPWCE